ncbi:neuroblast differentiation-associated protein AHNAK-like [Pollicipes pollicipes]|uniref:neuroblast differentiation-associated protein AHNAK-like n=1 Tax=Pollicipes pollicipes TaxID=41117 RepID=UPI00188529AB|nr:neuroblast differentiation-associated protein AHNAK-like [Pollicipes pollicipes]
MSEIKLPDGAVKTTFKPKAGFAWPKISLPSLQMPNWEFSSGARMPSAQAKAKGGLGFRMPSLGLKGKELQEFDIGDLLCTLIPKSEMPSVDFRDNSTVDILDLPGGKRRLVISTVVSEAEIPDLPANAKIEVLPGGQPGKVWKQEFDVDADFELPEIEGAEMCQVELPGGIHKKTFKPIGGLKWPEMHLPKITLPDWQLKSRERSPSPTKKDTDLSFGMKMPSFGFGTKGPKVPKFDGIDGMLEYLLPKGDLPKLRIRDDTEVDVIDLPEMKGRDVVVKTQILDVDLPKLPGDLKVEKVALPDGNIENILIQKFQANPELVLPKLSGADIDDVKLPDGSIKTSFRPKAGFKWPKVTLPSLQMPDWEFGSSKGAGSPDKKHDKGDGDFHFGMKMPSFGFGSKGPKVPKFDGLDGMLEYLLPQADLPKLRIRDNTEVDVIDLPKMKGRDVVVKTEIPDVDLPKLPANLKVEKMTLPDGAIKNMLNQKFQANAELPLPKLSGADVDEVKMPDGSIKTSFKPKAGFKWPKISLPSLQMPDWEFGSRERSPSPEKKVESSDGDFHFGMKMPSFGFGSKGPKIPKFDGLDGMLEYLLPEADLPKLRIRDNTEVDVIDLPNMKGRDVVVKTEIPDVDLPKLAANLKVDKMTLPDGSVKNMLNQKFQGNAELPLPKLSAADIDEVKLPDGSIKTSFKPKAGFKWPKISLPSLQMPDWEFGSRERSPSPEKKVESSDGDFHFGMKMPSFGFGSKGPKVPKFDGLDGMLEYLLPEADLPKLRIRDNTEVDVIDLPNMKGRDVVVKTEIPDVDLPKLSADLKVDKMTLPDGSIKNMLNQKFQANAELALPKLSGADIDEVKMPDGSIKTSFKPKAGFKWPKISLPSLQMPDWEFGSRERSPSPEKKVESSDGDFHFGMKMPSFGFGSKGPKIPKFDGLDGMLEYLLPQADLPKLRIRDNTEVDVIDLPNMKGRDVVVKTEIPDVDLPKLPANLKVEKLTLPDGSIKNMLNQKFQANAELALPKLSGADVDEVKLPDGSIKTSFKPKAGFKWPKISLPSLQMPDWEFGSRERSPSPEKKVESSDGDFHFGMKMPSFGFGSKGPKVPKFDGLDGMLEYLLPEADLPKLRIRDNTEVDVIDLPNMKGRDVVVKTEIPDVDLPKLPATLKVDKVTLPDGSIKNMLNQDFKANPELPLPKLSGADIGDITLPDGSIKTHFKPKVGFKWPKVTLPSLQLPDWQFGSSERSPSPERKGDGHFDLGIKMPSFGFGSSTKSPKVSGIDGLLGYLLPEADIPKLRIRDNTEVDVIDLPDGKGRTVDVRTEIPAADMPGIGGKYDVRDLTLPDGKVKHVLTQQFCCNAEVPLPKVGGSDVDSLKMPDGSMKTTFKPKAGFSWPKITLPSLQLPDWEFGSGGNKPSADVEADYHLGLSTPSYALEKGSKPPKLHGIDALLAYLLPEKDFPKLRIRDSTEVDVIDIPEARVRNIHVRTDVPQADIPKLPSSLDVEQTTLPDGRAQSTLLQKFSGDIDMVLPKVHGADIDESSLPNGVLKTTFKPKAGFKWPEITLPTLEMPDWDFHSEPSSASAKVGKGGDDHHFGIKMPSFGFGKGTKVPKLNGIDGLLSYLLPESDLPKLKIRDSSEVLVVDNAPGFNGRKIVVQTEIPDGELPGLLDDASLETITLPDGQVKHIMKQEFAGDASLPLPKVSGADIEGMQLPDGSTQTSFKPKAGFKWPKITMPSFGMPDWEFRSGERSPSPERKSSKDSEHHFGIRMPSFGLKKGVKTPKFDGIDGLLGYVLREVDLPKIRIKDDTEVDIIDVPEPKGRSVILRTSVPDGDLPKIPAGLQVNKLTASDGSIKNVMEQKFPGNVDLHLPKVTGADISELKLPDGAVKTTYRPKPGFKWPQITLPSLQMPDWEFGSKAEAKDVTLERKDSKGDHDFHLGLKMPSFGFKKSAKPPKFDGIDGLLGYLLPERDLPSLRIRDNTEVDVVDLPNGTGRDITVRTCIPDEKLSQQPAELKISKITLPDGSVKSELAQQYVGNAQLVLPKVSGAVIDEVKLPNGGLKTTYKPKPGFKWPKISLPGLQMPDWEFRSGETPKEKSSSLERGLKLPSFGFKKGVKTPKFDGLDGLLGYLIPETDLPKLRIRDNTEVDVIDLPALKGRDVVVKTEIPDVDLPKLSADLKTEKVTLPTGEIKNILNQTFKSDVELPLPKLSGADIDSMKLPDGSVKTSFKPKAGFKWPKITLPSLHMPDWQFGSSDRSPSPERKEKGDSDFHFGMKMPSLEFGKGTKTPKLHGIDALLAYFLPEADIPKLRIRDNTEVDVLDLPGGKGREVVLRTEVPDADLPKVPAGIQVDKVTLPSGKVANVLTQKFKADAALPMPKVSGADTGDVKLPDGSLKTTFKPKAGFKWPTLMLPTLEMPDWQFSSGERSPSPERKEKGDKDFHFGMKMPSFGFGKGVKTPKLDGIDNLLGYLLPEGDLPKLRIRDNTEVEVTDLPELKGRDVVVKTEIPDVDLPKLSADLKTERITLPDGEIKNMLNQKFSGSAELPLPKVSGADIDSVKLPDGSVKTSFKPKAGFKWPKITLPSLHMPDWQFGSSDRSPSPERKEKGDSDFHFGMKMPSLEFGKGTKTPKLHGIDALLAYFLPEADIPKLRIRDNTEVDVLDLSGGKGREVVLRTEVPDADLPKVPAGIQVDKVTLPSGKVVNVLTQKFKADAALPMPKVSGADTGDVKLPDGSLKTTFKPKAGFKWPTLMLPTLEMPDWQFSSGERSPSPERKGDKDFHFGMKMPSFGFGKGVKTPKLDGIDNLLGYLLPEGDLPKLRIRDNTEVEVTDLPELKGRDVVVKTEIPDVDLPKLSANLKTEKITLPDGEIKNMLNQKFSGSAELPLPKVSGADIDSVKLPDGSVKTSFKPKAGFKWPKITLPSLHMPDWQFGSSDRSPSPERKEKGDSDFHFGMKMPSLEFGKGTKTPKLHGIDALLAYFLPEADIPKLRIRDNTEVDVLDLPGGKGREVVLRTEVPDADLPKVPAGIQVDKVTLPSGKVANVLTQKFKADAALPMPKVSGADTGDVKLPDGSLKTTFKPKAGFKWPTLMLPTLEMPDWQFSSGERSPSPERKEKGDKDFHFGMKMPSFGFGKGVKTPKLDGIDNLLGYLLPEGDLPKLRIRDNTEVEVTDLPELKGRDVVVKTEIPDVDLPKLSANLKTEKITLPDGEIKNMLNQKFSGSAELPLPKVSGADIDSVKLPDGSVKTSFKPKAGFKWPKITLPSLHMPDWQFGSSDRSPSPERKEKGDSDFHFGMKMPSLEFGKGTKTPKLHGIDALLAYFLPEADIPKLRIRDNTEVDVLDLPGGKGREVVLRTEVPDADLPKVPAGIQVDKVTLPSGKVVNVLTQKFKADAALPMPKVSGADTGDVKLPDGSLKTTFKPKAGFKWPTLMLPTLEMPDWQFSSGERSPSPERKEKGDKDFHFGMKMPSFGFGKGVKTPKLDGIDNLLGYLLPEGDLPKLRIRDNTEVEVTDLPELKGRDVVVKTEIPDVDLPKLSANLKTEKITLPDGEIKNMLNQKFSGSAELPLPKVSGADIDSVKLPDGSVKTSFKPKAGFKWPKITLPSLHMPDWQFGSSDRSPSPERKEKGDSDFHFGMKMPSLEFGKGTKTPKLHGIDALLAYFLPEADIPKLRIRDNTEVDVLDLPGGKGREVVLRTEVPDADLPKVPAGIQVDKVTLPSGKVANVLTQKFKADAALPMPKVSGADTGDVKLPDGSLKTTFKPKAGFKWPTLMLPTLEMPDWQFSSGERSPSPERKEKGDKDFHFGMKMPSFGFGKGVKTPKLDGIDNLLGYLLPEGDLPKLRIRDNTEVEVTDLPELKGRDVVVKTEIPDVDLPKLSADLKTEKITLPDGEIKNMLNQKFSGSAELPLPKVSGADIDSVKLPDGSVKTSFKPKAGFKWPKITLPSLHMPDWQFGSSDRSPSPERKEKGDSDFHFGMKMPSLEFGKGTKTPKLHGIDALLAYFLPEADIPKLRIRDNTEVDVLDLPGGKGREVVLRTEVPDADLPKVPAGIQVDKVTLPSGKVANVLTQKFKADAALPMPKVSGADTGDVKLPDGSLKTTFKPKAGFKWPTLMLPTLEMPDWQFSSGERSPSPERKEKGDKDFHFGMKMPSFGFGKGVKTPKLDGIDNLLGYLLPEGDLPKLRIRDNTEVEVTDLPELKGRDVVVKTEIPDVDLPKLSANLKTEKITLPDGEIKNMLNQKFSGSAELPLPKVSGADIDSVKLPDGSVKTSFKPKAGFKWPKITLPSLHMPDWQFGSSDRSPSPERKEKGDSDFHFGMKMPSLEFGKGTKTPKLHGIDALLAYFLPEADIPKLRIRDNTEVDVLDLPGGKGREVVLRTEVPDADLPKVPAGIQVDKVTLPSGKVANVLTQKFKADAALPMPKVSGADTGDVKLPDGSLKTTFKPKAGFKWPTLMLPTLEMPDWQFSSGERSPSPERKEKGDKDFHFGMKMPSFGFGKGVKTPKLDGIDNLLGYLLPEGDLPKLRIRDNTEVEVIDLPELKGRDVVVMTEIPDVDLPKLSADLKTEKITLPDGEIKNMLNQKFSGSAELPLPKVSGADIDSVKLPDGSVKTSFKPKAGFKWPKITLPSLHMPDWHFGGDSGSYRPEEMQREAFLSSRPVVDSGIDGIGDLVMRLIPRNQLSSLVFTETSEVHVETPRAGSGSLVVVSNVSDLNVTDLLPNAEIDTVSLPDGGDEQRLTQRFALDPGVEIPDVVGVDVVEFKLPNGTIRRTLKPQRGVKWPEVHMPLVRSAGLEGKLPEELEYLERDEKDSSFKFKLPSFGLKKGAKPPKVDGVDGLLEYLLPREDLPKLRVRDNSEVDVIDIPGAEAREVEVRTVIPEADLPKIPSDSNVVRVNMPDGSVRHTLCQNFPGNSDLPLPRVSGADISEVTLPNGNIKATYKPKPGFKWPKISLPSFQLPDWDFGSGDRSPSPERKVSKSTSKKSHVAFKKPKFDGISDLFLSIVPKSKLPSIQFRDNSTIDVEDLPSGKRQLVITTEIPEAEIASLPPDAKVEVDKLPSGKTRKVWRQYFDVDPDFQLPEIDGTEVEEVALPDGTSRTTYKPTGGFKWPEFQMPKFHLPGWEFKKKSSETSTVPKPKPLPQASKKPMKKPPNFLNIDGVLEYLVPDDKLSKLRIRDTTEVEVIDLPRMKVRDVIVRTEVQRSDVSKLPSDVPVLDITRPSGRCAQVIEQHVKADADLVLPTCSSSNTTDAAQSDGSVKTIYQPRKGTKWPKLKLPALQVPDWEFRSSKVRSRSPSPASDDEGRFSFSGLFSRFLPSFSKDKAEIEVEDHPEHGQQFVVKTEVPDDELANVPEGAQIEVEALPDGRQRRVWRQPVNTEIRLDSPEIELTEEVMPDGRVRKTVKPKAGFEWPSFSFGFGGKKKEEPEAPASVLSEMIAESDLPKVKFMDGSEIEMVELPDGKRQAVITTEINESNIDQLPAGAKVQEETMPDGRKRRVWYQYFDVEETYIMPRFQTVEIIEIVLPDGSKKRKLKPKTGVQWSGIPKMITRKSSEQKLAAEKAPKVSKIPIREGKSPKPEPSKRKPSKSKDDETSGKPGAAMTSFMLSMVHPDGLEMVRDSVVAKDRPDVSLDIQAGKHAAADRGPESPSKKARADISSALAEAAPDKMGRDKESPTKIPKMVSKTPSTEPPIRVRPASKKSKSSPPPESGPDISKILSTSDIDQLLAPLEDIPSDPSQVETDQDAAKKSKIPKKKPTVPPRGAPKPAPRTPAVVA